MFDLEDDASRREKCYTAVAQLPCFIDSKQPPMKKSPFSAIWGHPFVHTVEVTLPEATYKTIESSLDTKLPKLRYARVFMSLSSLLEGDFFNAYIKSGNILMISEGRSGSDNVFTLRDGILKLELGKEIFERTGLTGKPIRSGGRKHTKERYLVKINLRLPSMLHGKKGFEKLVWAFKNVLNHTVAWLFYDLASVSCGISSDDPSLKGNHPHIIDCEPVRTEYRDILVPPFKGMNITETAPEQELKDYCDEISEWLGMVALGSPRVLASDDVDPYLCRYSIPDADEAKPSGIVSLRWHGFLSSKWIMELFLTLLQETSPKDLEASSWFAFSASALGREAVEGKDGYTVLTFPSEGGASDNVQKSSGTRSKIGRSCVCWEYVGVSIV
ncbi:ribonuclease P 40kDa subunit-domain-containing protein [Aspergillus caelatus]|uniref:Ribonuclease P 40kDa subunit-domain-containing protein n=1 Tax=Aspergillus caelatus TaxID=61420 RepID=A0A5N7A455_9EURO|nr:ribonuclease P 40kDa subunit-domain-containing protein [Aspergillus caelatus]KAE8364363.1 ribonuclease P 40kDa subunit-domain-containing protein [Aspergillus caelatus]